MDRPKDVERGLFFCKKMYSRRTFDPDSVSRTCTAFLPRMKGVPHSFGLHAKIAETGFEPATFGS